MISLKSLAVRRLIEMAAKKPLLEIGATLALCLSFPHPAGGQKITGPPNVEPPDVSATLYARDSTTGMPVPIQDSDFAKQLQDILTANGKSNVKDAVFLFQQCYGGGFLSRLKELMNAAKVVSVGGSASAFDQEAAGPAIQFGGPQLPGEMNPWTHAIFNTISSDLSTDATVTLFTELEKSKGDDKEISHGKDTPQVMVTGGDELSLILGEEEGKKITLKDPEAKSHHAILFAGASKKGDASDYNDVTNMLMLLGQAWGDGAGANIQILFGDGTHQPDGVNPLDFPGVPAEQIYSATKENLAKALEKVKGQLNTDEQFIFYATDHGGSSLATHPSPTTESTTKALLYSGQIEGAQQLGAVPTVTVQFLPQPTSVQPVLEVDGRPVGALDTTGSSATFAVNGLLFQLETEVATYPPFAIQEFILSTGPVDKFPPPSHGQPLSLTISGPPSVTSSSSTLYVTYQASINFADGSTITVFPNWTLTSTAPGVTIDPYTGFVTISPISAPTTVTIQATWTDPDTGTTVTADQTVVIGSQPTLSLACPTESTAMLDGSYASSFNATGGTGSYVAYSITGSLPPGLGLNSSTGAVTGSPIASGAFTFEGAVADTGGHTALSPVCTIIVE